MHEGTEELRKYIQKGLKVMEVWTITFTVNTYFQVYKMLQRLLLHVLT